MSSGNRFYISFVDMFSRYTWIYFLRHKSEALSVFIAFHKFAERQLGFPLKEIQTVWGGEFSPYLLHHDIKHRVTCPHISQQNGVVERKHRHVVELGLTLLA